MLVICRRIEPRQGHDLEIVLPFDLRQKSRLRIRLENGEEACVLLDRGRPLRDGDCLIAEDGRVVRVAAQPEKLLEITCASRQALTRVAYHLGNRHVPLQVGDGWVRIVEDDVLRHMVEGLGARVRSIQAPFEPEPGAYGGHHSTADQAQQRGVIHEFRAIRAGSASGEGR
jgi:urease accessory protein